MSKIFVTRPIPEAGLQLLRDKKYDVVVNEKAANRAATEKEMIAGVKDADAMLSVLTDKIDMKVMDAGKNVKVIANYAVGYDNIDVAEATKRNIIVTNTPGVLTETVAEHTFALMLAIARRIAEADRYARGGKYHAWGPLLLLGSDVSRKTLGIVGLGRIGSRVAHHAKHGFDMKVLYYDVKRNEDFEKEVGAQYTEIDEIFRQADFVSIHVPLLSSTKHLVNEGRLNSMKQTAYLVNTSRGPVIDEKALIKALQNKTIRGAALDVFEEEPVIPSEMEALDNIIMTPHIASGTEGTRNKMAEMAAENIIAVLEGKEAPNKVVVK